nr:movement protein [Tea plant necrotic ring blotch virus]
MSIAALYSKNGDISTSSLDELNSILTENYKEDDVIVKRLSRRFTCSGSTGIGWFTPDELLKRFSDHIVRLFEDKGVVSKNYQNSFRLYHDLVLVIVPQVRKSSEVSMTLSLVDSGTDLVEDLLDMDVSTVTVSASEGPQIVIFHPSHSIPNMDRLTLNGKESHRRLGIRYMIETNSSVADTTRDVTYFTMSATWKREMSLNPSYYDEQVPTVIPILPGFREHAALKNPKLLKVCVGAGLNLRKHLSAQRAVVGDVKLAVTDSKKTDVSELFKKPVRKKNKLITGNRRENTTATQQPSITMPDDGERAGAVPPITF